MSLKYIRNAYNVPATKGQMVVYTGDTSHRRIGVITGALGSHIKIKFDGEKESKSYHPTWRIEYLNAVEKSDD